MKKYLSEGHKNGMFLDISNANASDVIRQSYIGELKTIQEYDIILNSNLLDSKCKEILKSIRDEEVIHCQELERILEIIEPDKIHLKNKGNEEVNEIEMKYESPLDEAIKEINSILEEDF